MKVCKAAPARRDASEGEAVEIRSMRQALQLARKYEVEGSLPERQALDVSTYLHRELGKQDPAKAEKFYAYGMAPATTRYTFFRALDAVGELPAEDRPTLERIRGIQPKVDQLITLREVDRINFRGTPLLPPDLLPSDLCQQPLAEREQTVERVYTSALERVPLPALQNALDSTTVEQHQTNLRLFMRVKQKHDSGRK